MQSRRNLYALLLCAVVLTSALASAAELRPDAWTKVSTDHKGHTLGAVWVKAPDLGKMLLFGNQMVVGFDPGKMQWETFSDTPPPGVRKEAGFRPYYRGVWVPERKTFYCLNAGSQIYRLSGTALYSFSCTEKKWTRAAPAPELAGLSWLSMAYDPIGKRLVVVGSDKRIDNLGWTRTVLYDLGTGKWSDLPLPSAEIRKKHKNLVAATERAIDLGGRTRSAWYRDPKGKGKGTAEERAACEKLLAEVQGMPGAKPAAAKLKAAAALIKSGDMLKALKAVRAAQRKLEDAAFEQYPVPRSRRNSPLVYDAKNKVFVLFGGDHEDYHINDTWILDLAKKAWTQVSPAMAPSPRAGHALCYLPKSGRVAMYGGYIRYTHMSYGCKPSVPLDPRQLWTYDVAKNKWELLKAWPAGKGAALPSVGGFFGYTRDFYNAPPMLADGKDNLFIAQHGGKKTKSVTWALNVNTAGFDAGGTAKYGKVPNTRLYKTGNWVASFGEVDAAPKPTNLGALPANKWVRLPKPPRNFCAGSRQRDWGTYIWDSDRDQILMWGGGHCVAGASNVAHYSPISGRMVEGYDADESYSAFGRGAYDSSVMNRPWIAGHNYNHYAYDHNAKLMVTTRGYLYDPDRMDWLRVPRIKQPFRFKMLGIIAETTKHGVVVWGPSAKGGGYGLWLFDGKKREWTDLQPKGKLPGLYADSEGAVYDSKRDRLLMAIGGGYRGMGKGTIISFDFKTKEVKTLAPGNAPLGSMKNAREIAYVPEADLLFFGGHPYVVGGTKKDGRIKGGRALTRVYDCAKNRYMLLDAGPTTYGHSSGWMYDSKRKNVYAISLRGQCYALRVEAKTLKLLDKPPEK